MGQPALDSEKLLERLRNEHRVLKWEPLPPDTSRSAPKGDQVRSAESLAYINANWVLPHEYEAPGGAGVKARIVAFFGALTFRVLGPYLRAERDLLSHMVRINNALEHRCDELTMRCEQLSQDMVARQAAEARNLAKLAVLLQVDSTGTTGTSGADPAGPKG